MQHAFIGTVGSPTPILARPRGRLQITLNQFGSPNASAVFADRARLYAKQREFKKCVADCGEAIRLDQKNADAYAFRAFALWQSGYGEKALNDCNKALEWIPHKYALVVRGRLYYEMGRTGKAITDLNRVLESDPNYGDARCARMGSWRPWQTGRGPCGLQRGHSLVAQLESRHNGRAEIFFAMKEYEKTFADCEEAVRL